ncbi:MAG: helix-turn-helix domain-containing protein [Patescibacteria group bacterium]|jgi:hypothetical protein
MPVFASKKLPLEETWGEKLRQKRHYQNLKIEDIAKTLNIRTEYLIALEEERFDKLPSGLYGKNFLKQYAIFLGFKPADLLTVWDSQSAEYSPNDPFSRKTIKPHKFIVLPKIIRNTLIASAVLICFLYLIFYFKNITSLPKLTIIYPVKNLLTSKNSIIVSGWVEPGAEITINNENVLNNNNGYFSQKVNLKKGLNNLIITAKKKYSQTQVIAREILVE